MRAKHFFRALFYPHTAILCLLLPCAAAALIYVLLTLPETDPLCIGSYVLAFYTLVVWCLRIPAILRFFRNIRRENRYVRRWLEDPGLRMNITVTGAVLWNGTYAILQLGLGLYHHSAWFYSLALYYASLAAMRFFLLHHTLRHKPGEKPRQELIRYRTCGWIFLLVNAALSAMMFDMIRQNRTVRHHEITTIAMAAYTFTTLTVAIINVVKYRKYNSPALSATKAISLAAACVSLLTLENTMLATFSSSTMTPQTRQLFLCLSGGAVSLFMVIMAICMIRQGSKKISCLENER